MNFLLIVSAIVALWAWKSGRLRDLRFGDIAAVTAGLVALKLASNGRMGMALMAGAGVFAWVILRGRRAGSGMAGDEARRLLEVPADADAETIRAAHRRLISRVHPDTGGSAELSRKVNEARDTLISELKAK